jgi:signal peptidase I
MCFHEIHSPIRYGSWEGTDRLEVCKNKRSLSDSLVSVFVCQCLGPSMLPTFNVSGDILLLEHLSSKFEKVRPGDVVMARSPVNPNLVVCKRVLGLEGDRVTVLPTSSRGHVKQVVVCIYQRTIFCFLS